MTAPTAEALEQRAREMLAEWELEPAMQPEYERHQGIPVVSVTTATRAMLAFAAEQVAAGVAAERERAAGVCLAVIGQIGATTGSSIDSALREAARAIRQEPKP